MKYPEFVNEISGITEWTEISGLLFDQYKRALWLSTYSLELESPVIKGLDYSLRLRGSENLCNYNFKHISSKGKTPRPNIAERPKKLTIGPYIWSWVSNIMTPKNIFF